MKKKKQKISNQVPEYEIVPLLEKKLIDKQNETAERIIQLNSFNEEVTLYLSPLDGYLAGLETPVFQARYDPGAQPNRVSFNRIPGVRVACLINSSSLKFHQ